MSLLFPEETGQSNQLICEKRFSVPEGEIKPTSVVDSDISTAATSQSPLTSTFLQLLVWQAVCQRVLQEDTDM